jgi:hypothetical protein
MRTLWTILIRRMSDWLNTSAPHDPVRIAMPQLRGYPTARP